jgi:hypothetical protein
VSFRSLLFVIAIAALLVAALTYSHAQRRWQARTVQWQQQLLAAAKPAAPTAGDAIAALPAPVARWLNGTLRAGERTPRKVQVTWRGEFNLCEPGRDRWVPFTATQVFVPGAPGFVWDAQMRAAPGFTVNVRDAYLGGRAAMQGKALALFSVVDREGGDAFAVAALQRYLGELLWAPAALLPSPALRWDPLDAQRARATLADAGVQAVLDFHFDAGGLVERVWAAQRTFDDGKRAPSVHPWQARVLAWGEVDGARVPTDAVVEWLLPGGPYAYWRGQPVAIVRE